jgi:phosphopantothenoylcysteine synthetase/decarboxylase
MHSDSPIVRPIAIVTCGPGVAPVDSVRRITNYSTGELGVRLAEGLFESGWDVVCFKSSAATFRDPVGAGVTVRYFATNDELLQGLAAQSERESVYAVFQTAALCDYEVASVCTADGLSLADFAKISSEYPELHIALKPAQKVLPHLKQLFPSARVVGWKFEMDGDRANSLSRGARQIQENGCALCVVNGAAYGAGFGILDAQGSCSWVSTRSELCAWLTKWVGSLVVML